MVKMVKMGCRGYLVGNGFSRFLRHSPTTCPFHSWKYTTVLLSFHAIQFLVLVLLSIWRWQSIIDPVTTVSLTHLSFPTKGFALDQQCASPNPTIKWVKVMKSITWMRKAIHYRFWMLIERICTNTDITAIAINPLSSYQSSSTSSQYNNNHLHVSVILEFHFVNNCTLRTHQISLFDIVRPLLILASRFKARPVQPLAFLSIWSMID